MSDFMVKFSGHLYLKLEVEGGRRTPINNGFRTDIRFKDDEYRMVLIEFKEEILVPGESTEVQLNILLHSDDEVSHFLEMRKTYIRDGAFVIGDVEILDLITSIDVS